MADLITPGNCPIKGKDSGICMCSRIACSDVKEDHCFWMRSAFTYGFTIAETKASESMGMIRNKIDEIFLKVGEQE